MPKIRNEKYSLAILSVGLGVVSCGSPQDEHLPDQGSDETEVTSSSQALTDEPIFDDGSCIEADNIIIPRIRAAFTEARRTLTSPLMDSCLMNAWGAYSSSGFAERLLSEARDNVPLIARCDSGLQFDAFTPGGNLIVFNQISVLINNVNTIASWVLHEVGHMKGFGHPNKAPSVPDNDNPDPSPFRFFLSPEFRQSFNEQLVACSLAISNGHPRPIPAGGRRDDLFPGTTLAAVGGAGGDGFEQVCDAVTGLRGRSGALIDAIGPSCIFTPAPPLAGSQVGGGPFTLNCQPDELLVGVQGVANADTLVGIGPMCEKTLSVRQGRRTEADIIFRGFRGGTAGTLFRRWCPPRMYVNALRGRAGSLVDRFEVDCANISSTGTLSPFVSETTMPQVGGNGGRVKIQKCAGQSVVTGFHLQADASSVVRLGGECSGLTKACSTCDETLSNVKHLLLAEGGNEGKVGWASCPVGSALIGFSAQVANGLVKGLVGRCVPATAWAGTGPRPALTFTTSFLRGADPITITECPRGSFVTGWQSRTGAKVDALSLRCRNF
jgi:hypothetical protein